MWRRALDASLSALMTVVVTLIPVLFDVPHARASTSPVCNAHALLVNLDFDGPGNPSGAMVIQPLTKGICELSGQPQIEVFTSSHRKLKLSESTFEFTPRLPPPASPILLSPTHPWAVVEMSWCGFAAKYSQIDVRFPGWKHFLAVNQNIGFDPPACVGTRASQLAIDVIRRLTARGIAGRHSHVAVTPSSILRNGEKVRVSVSGFGLGAKFFVSECANAQEVNPAGCGGQLALQSFGLTNMIGDGSSVVTVRNRAATGLSPKGPFLACLRNCVLVATSGEGGASSYATLRFG